MHTRVGTYMQGLWQHEVTRVFVDRLTTTDEQEWAANTIDSVSL